MFRVVRRSIGHGRCRGVQCADLDRRWLIGGPKRHAAGQQTRCAHCQQRTLDQLARLRLLVPHRLGCITPFSTLTHDMPACLGRHSSPAPVARSAHGFDTHTSSRRQSGRLLLQVALHLWLLNRWKQSGRDLSAPACFKPSIYLDARAARPTAASVPPRARAHRRRPKSTSPAAAPSALGLPQRPSPHFAGGRFHARGDNAPISIPSRRGPPTAEPTGCQARRRRRRARRRRAGLTPFLALHRRRRHHGGEARALPSTRRVRRRRVRRRRAHPRPIRRRRRRRRRRQGRHPRRPRPRHRRRRRRRSIWTLPTMLRASHSPRSSFRTTRACSWTLPAAWSRRETT